MSPVYVYSFAVNNKSIVNSWHSRKDIEQDDDRQGDVPTPEEMKGTLIPGGPYPLITEGRSNFFDSSQQGQLSHFQPPKSCCHKKVTYEGCMGFISHCS